MARTALWHTARCRFSLACHPPPGLEKAVDQGQQPRIGHAGFQARPQPVVIDPIEEAFKVPIHRPAVACMCRTALVGRTVRAEIVAVEVKMGVRS